MPPMTIKITATRPLTTIMFFTILVIVIGSVLLSSNFSQPNDCLNSGSIDVSQTSWGLVAFSSAKVG